MSCLQIRNWKKFQHFKDRRPPWIKLYRDLLDSHEWHLLDGDSSKTLVMLWLLASETDTGTIPPISEIAFRLRMTEPRIKSILTKLSPWLEQADITAISPRYQDGPSETETETETETEKTNTSFFAKKADTDGSLPEWGTPEALVALYNTETPDECPAVTTLTDARKKKSKVYLRQFPDRAFWETVCQRIHQSSFLRGLKGTPGHEHFRASFDWLLTKGKDQTENVVKVFEGRYADG